MTWQEAQEKAKKQGNLPANIKEWEKSDYIRYQAEVFFNEFHKINHSYCEWCRNAKHAIIANCLYRQN